ncbi:MAG: ATPase P [Lachnospiraceae bacterium]|nr:ATPase P [Lachnospiraceae bacterium]
MFKTTLKIDGMMCGMCEAHINDVIRKTFPNAKKVSSSHKKGVSTFLLEEKPDRDVLETAIGETGYKLMEMSCEPYNPKESNIFSKLFG